MHRIGIASVPAFHFWARGSPWWSILRNSGIVLVANFASKLLVFAATALIARMLGPQSFGWYSFILAFVWFVAILPEFGIDSILTRDLARRPETSADALGAALTLRLVLIAAAITFGLVLFQILGYPSALTGAVAIGMVYVVSLSLTAFAETHFRARLAMMVPAGAKIMAKAVFLVLVLLVLRPVRPDLRLFVALGVTVLPDLLGTAVVAVSMWRRVKPHLAFGWATWRPLLRESWPLALTTICMMVYLRVDMLMLSKLSGAEALGNYAAAVGLVEVWGGVALALGISLIPVLSRLAGGEETAGFWKTYHQSFSGLMFLLVPVCFFFATYADGIIAVVYGTQYRDGARALSLLIWAQIFTASSVLYTIALTVHRRLMTILGLAAASAVVNVLANAFLIPVLGILGAAIATLLGYSTGAAILLGIESTRAYIMPLFRASAIPLLASLIFVGVAHWVDADVVVAAVICPVVYLAGAAVLHKVLGPRFRESGLARG